MLITANVLLATGIIFVGWGIRQTQQVPEFYQRAETTLPKSTAKASKHLVEEVESLQQDVAQIGSWHAEFDGAEINAWLVEELPRKFPHLLAKGAHDPRIVIEENRLLAAVQYEDKRIRTVISCEFAVELTEQPNMLALRVTNLRAGSLPLPLINFAVGISKEAAKGDVDIRWDVTDSGPIALVTVPSEHPKYAVSPVVVESVRLEEGKLVLSGHTGPLAKAAFKPRGPVHQFVSFRPKNRRRQTAQRSDSSEESRRKLR